jgi:hypothetical protein
MPSLIDLKTDLKSLRYGKDTLGGGYSGQPYIQTSIPDSFNDLGAREDFILRGGIGAVRDSLTDIKRLGKMFVDTKSPNGLLFIAKQQLLSRTAVRTQTSGILNEGGYSPLNTLAQAGLVAFGGHLNKQGINPFAETGIDAKNDALYNSKVKSTQPLAENRLYQLTKAGVESRPIDFDGRRVILNNGLVNVMTYTGGPGSILGVGNTAIRYSKLSQTPLTKSPGAVNFTTDANTLGQNDWAFSSQLIEQQPDTTSLNGASNPTIKDFRQILRDSLEGKAKERATNSGATTLSQDYSIGGAANFTQRVNIGDPGQRGNNNYSDYALGVLNKQGNSAYSNVSLRGIGDSPSTLRGGSPTDQFGLDKINSLPIYRSENVSTDDIVNDFVKFRIAVIDNDDPRFKTFMHFRAFLGPISDSYNANWNSFQYLGRGENFYTYGGFTRTISLSWTVAAQSKQELIPMYKKLNFLASTLAPDYSPNGYMRGNLVQLTIGGYLYEQPGFITGLTYEMGEESPWEIGIGTEYGTGDGTVKELTQIIKVTGFNFTPIQKFIPRLQNNSFSTNAVSTTGEGTGFASSYGQERFIALANGPDDKNSNYNYSDTTPPTPINPIQPTTIANPNPSLPLNLV